MFIIYFITVRLVNGPTKYEGRVEVYHNGEWGIVCGNGWDLNDAQVVCRELGFGPAIVATNRPLYGQSDDSVLWLNNVYCVGTESTIEDCSLNRWGYQYCSPYQYSSVLCSASDGNINFSCNSCICVTPFLKV